MAADKIIYDLSKFEKALEGTVLRGFNEAFQKQIYSKLKAKKENNFVLENIDALAFSEKRSECIPGLREALLGVYNNIFSENYSYIIPDVIKVTQGMMMDSLAFGVNMQTGDVALYTMNIRSLFGLGVDQPKLYNTCFDLNSKGIIHAYRIDSTYRVGDKLEFKAVNLIANKKLQASNFCFFPYEVVYAAMRFISGMLDRGVTFRVVQTLDSGVIKERFISLNENLLGAFCDNASAVKGLKVEYYPVKGYMYAPVLGAPSITAMVSQINMFNLDTLSPVTSKEELKVTKAANPIENMILRESISIRFKEMNKSGGWEFMDAVEAIPGIDSYFKSSDDKYMVSEVGLSKILNKMSQDDLNKVCDAIGARGAYNSIKLLVNENSLVDTSGMSVSGLRKLLANGVYNVIIRGMDCKMHSIMVTNSKKVLSQVYGEGYFAKYESFGPRYWELVRRVSNGIGTPEEILTYCGFPVHKNTLEYVKNYNRVFAFYNAGDTEKAKAYEDLKESTEQGMDDDSLYGLRATMLELIMTDSESDFVFATFDKDRKINLFDESKYLKSESTSPRDNILCRSCFGAYEEDGKIKNYYRYVNIDRVVRLIKIG